MQFGQGIIVDDVEMVSFSSYDFLCVLKFLFSLFIGDQE